MIFIKIQKSIILTREIFINFSDFIFFVIFAMSECQLAPSEPVSPLERLACQICMTHSPGRIDTRELLLSTLTETSRRFLSPNTSKWFVNEQFFVIFTTNPPIFSSDDRCTKANTPILTSWLNSKIDYLGLKVHLRTDTKRSKFLWLYPGIILRMKL